MSLNNDEKSSVERAVQAQKVLSTTVARLYFAANGKWNYTKKMGAVVLCSKNLCNYLTLVDLKSEKILFEQELYEQFQYSRPVDFFHTFETDNEVAGLSFASEVEAEDFYSAVQAATRTSTRQAFNTSPAVISRPEKPMTRPEKPMNRPVQRTQDSDNSISAPVVDRAQFHTIQRVENFKPVNVEPSQPVKVQSATLVPDKKKKKKKDDDDFVISEPRNFVHKSSIGWNADKGFEIRNIPPEWKRLFKEVGIKPKDLKDKETAAVIFDVIQKETNGTLMVDSPAQPTSPVQSPRPPPPPPQQQSPSVRPPPPPSHPSPSSRAPPPPPNKMTTPGGRPPPPPNRPANLAKRTGVPPPPPNGRPAPKQQSVVEEEDIPEPPPPPMDYDEPTIAKSPTLTSTVTSSNPLFAAIQSKQAILKPVSQSPSSNNAPPPPQGLAATLAKAMEARRGAIREDEAEEEEDWGDDWE